MSNATVQFSSVNATTLAAWETDGAISPGLAAAAAPLLERALVAKQRYLADTAAREAQEATAAAAATADVEGNASEAWQSNTAAVRHVDTIPISTWTVDGFSGDRLHKGHPDHPSNLYSRLSCCKWRACLRRKQQPFSMYTTRYFGGLGPDFPPYAFPQWMGLHTVRQPCADALYRVVSWIGYASGAFLTGLGLAAAVVLTSLIAGLYARGECVVPADNERGDDDDILSLASVVLVSFTQIVGGGTAPGTIRSDVTTCALVAIVVSALNVALRSLLFAAGLTALNEVESEVVFSGKACVAARNGQPSLLVRFAAPSSSCATIESIYATMTLFQRSEEGDSMTQSTRLRFKTFVTCHAPVTASHVINASSPLAKIFKMDLRTGRVVRTKKIPRGLLNMYVLVYDHTTCRYAHRHRIWKLDELMHGHVFADVMECGVFEAALSHKVPISHMENMHHTTVQAIHGRIPVDETADGHEKTGEEEEKEEEEKDDANVKRALDRIRPKVWRGNKDSSEDQGATGLRYFLRRRRHSDKNDNSNDDDDNDNHSNHSDDHDNDRSARSHEAVDMRLIDNWGTPEMHRLPPRGGNAMAHRLFASLSPNVINIFELDNWEEYLPGLGQTEARMLAHIVSSGLIKARELCKLRKEAGSEKKGDSPNEKHESENELYVLADEDADLETATTLDRFVHFCRTWDQSEYLRAESEWRAERDALERRWCCNRRRGCIRLFCSCWSCTCCASRRNWTSSRTLTAGLNGELGTQEWGCTRTNRNPGTQPNALYTLRWAIHAGALPSLGLALIAGITMLALGLAAVYQAGECFVEPWEAQMAVSLNQSGLNANESASGAASPAAATAAAATAVHTFDQALSSSFVQLATGSPSDPMRYDSPTCAILILLASATNLFFRVVVFSVFLHMLERAKPSVFFSPQLCLFLRNGRPVIQARMVAPSAVCMHVKSCEWNLVMPTRTIEGTVYGQIEKLSSHIPPFLAMPICTTHTIDEHSCLWQYFAEHGTLPPATIVIKVGLWDVVSSQYSQVIRAFTLKRDVRMFRHFDDTIRKGISSAWTENTSPVFDMSSFLSTHSHVSRDPEALSALNSGDPGRPPSSEIAAGPSVLELEELNSSMLDNITETRNRPRKRGRKSVTLL